MAWAINDAGQVVGQSDDHVFLYEGGQMTDLNDLLPADSGWVLQQALDINNKGEIAGVGTLNAQQRAFLLSPPDTIPPDITISSGPSGLTNSASPAFAFTSTEAGSMFRCSLDGEAYSPCSSPKRYSGLSNSRHAFRVLATDRAGNTDLSPAVRSFTVDTVRPAVRTVVPTGNKVAPAANVSATFSEQMKASSINKTTVKLTKKGSSVPVLARVSYSAATKKAMLDPAKPLTRNATYTATITTGTRVLAANPLAKSKVWSFTVKK